MYESAQQFIQILDAKNLKYQYQGRDADGDDVVMTGFAGDYTSLRTLLFFDETNNHLAIRTDDLVKFPEDKLNDMLLVVNEENARFRFVKFVIDMRDYTIHGAVDAILSGGDVGETCFEYVIRTFSVCDDAYSAFMKKLWGSSEDTEN